MDPSPDPGAWPSRVEPAGPPGWPSTPPPGPPAWSGAPSGAWAGSDGPQAGVPLEEPPALRWGCGDIAAGIGLYILGTIVGVIPVVVAVVAVGGAGGDAATAEGTPGVRDTLMGVASITGLLGGWAGMVGWMFYASRRKGLGTFRDDFGFTARWVDVPLGIGVGFAVMFGAAVASTLVERVFGGQQVSNTEDILGVSQNAAVTVTLVLLATFGAPIVEELFFRGLTLRAMERRFGTVPAIIGSTVLFAVLHWQIGEWRDVLTLVAGIATMGACFAVLANRTGRLGGSIVAHMTVNGTASLVFLLTSHLGS